jgi:hypothetical protein
MTVLRRSALPGLLVCAALLVTSCATNAPAVPKPKYELGAGFRWSVYGPQYHPAPEYWATVGLDMARRFPGAHPETIWIVSKVHGQGTLLNFPASPRGPLIATSEEDGNEAVLELFDRLGFRVWLQVEPGYASVDELIDLVMSRYRHHPSVIGFGIDVEWFRSTNPDHGDPITDAQARAWVEAVRRHGRGLRLFLKHFALEKMPPNERDGILFVDDSQILPDLQTMVDEFAVWGRTFAPAPVAFQYGYPSDQPWWSRLQDPPADVGRAILARVPNTAGLYWVDFTVLDVFPPAQPPAARGPDPLSGAWEFVSGRYTTPDGNVVEEGAPGLRSLKVLNDAHFVYLTTRADGTFIRSAGGRYSIDGATYAETIDAASAEVMRGKTYSFEWRLDGDLWYHSGTKDGVRLEEVWRRAGPPR